ncbi:hypothetical protein [Xanthomonas sp. WHRI 8932A]|uniref:hypothetical protein n=1 Tax=unclassified Xanthomonas TaxID=2643310 RepID=UPI002B223FCD|nr:hypothetical protein [Xanthomonas sp. WHRI 8932A]MEA9565893.1 hypothetical protein [Xanthomonas sp. WHRI 8932A]
MPRRGISAVFFAPVGVVVCGQIQRHERVAAAAGVDKTKALLLFGFASGGRRRSEIAAADCQDLRCIGEDALQAGLNGDFGGHSLRSGFIT